MKYYLFIVVFTITALFSSPSFSSHIETSNPDYKESSKHLSADQQDDQNIHSEDNVAHGHAAPLWSVIPFVLLLGMIATGPLFYEHFWHKNYPKIAVLLAAIVVVYYLLSLKNVHSPIHAAFEYIQFIALLTGLYIASGGIMIDVSKKATPLTNSLLLVTGAIIANIIGTTGASMLLIRPFIRLNKTRIKAYHIIFFIFIVSNIGGSLTPIGDPPLFLGFLKGVPFFWTLTHNVAAWAFGIALLTALFYWLDKKNKSEDDILSNNGPITNKISIKGGYNFIWLAIVVGAVFLDPNVFEWVPAIHYHGQKFSFVREIIMLSVAYFSFRFANKEVLKTNEFNFEPIKEVAFIFIGIFATMMPALELVGNFAKSPAGTELITHNTLYWGTGMLSGFLDNAPTYLNFLAAGMAAKGADINNITDVTAFANGAYNDSIFALKAISIAAVFFGAFSYIGNGPNFMVKSIAEQVGIKMPSFFGYIIRYSIPVLLPLFIVVWLIFFAFIK